MICYNSTCRNHMENCMYVPHIRNTGLSKICVIFDWNAKPTMPKYRSYFSGFNGRLSFQLCWRVHAFFMTYFHCWYIAAIFLLGYCMNTKLLEMQKPNSYHLMGLNVLGIRCWNRLNQIWSIRWGVWRGWMRIVWSPLCFKTMAMGSSVSLAQP